MKNAFNPIPGASATGRFAKIPIISVAIAADTAVAKNTPPTGKPVAASMKLLTGRIYAIAKKIVTPAKISFVNVEPLCSTLKNCLIFSILVLLFLFCIQYAYLKNKKTTKYLHQ